MTTTAKSPMQELRERHKSERKEARAKESVLRSLPVPTQRICIFGNEAHISYETAERFPARMSIPDACKIIDAFRPFIVESEHWKDSCVTCKPAAINKVALGDGGHMDGSSAVELVLNAGEGFSAHKLTFWALIDGRHIQVSIEIQPLSHWIPRRNEIRDDRTGRLLEVRFDRQPLGEGSFRKWWHPPGGYRFSYYLADLPNWDSWASHELAQKKGAA